MSSYIHSDKMKASKSYSTLDMLKRPYEFHILEKVSHEMSALAIADQKQERQKPKPTAFNTCILNLGEKPPKSIQKYLPGTPIARMLRGGKLVRLDGKENHVLTRLDSALDSKMKEPFNHQKKNEVKLTPNAKDSLDVPVQMPYSSKTCQNEQKPVEQDEVTFLQQHRGELEKELLHVTKKLYRKYSKKLYPKASSSPNKMKILAEKWTRQSEMTESEKYALYMDGRYSTQTQLDYYERPLGPREVDNNKHRKNTMHTKYGDALVMHKKSLRGAF